MSLREKYLARALNALERKRGLAPSNLRVLQGNSSFSTARVVGLAEQDHSDDSEFSMIAKTLVSVTTPNDLVLIEGVQSGEKVSEPIRLLFALSPTIDMRGWDDMEAHTETGRLYAKLLALDPLSGIDPEAGGLFAPSPQVVRERRDVESKIATQTGNRNASLLQTLEQSLKQTPQGRILVYSGRKHLIDNYGFLNRLRQERYTIVTPESRSRKDPIRQMDYLKRASGG